MKRHFILTVPFVFLVCFLQGQDVNGLWMKIRNPDVIPIGSPFIEIIEFTSNSMSISEFNVPYSKHKVSFSESKMNYNDSIAVTYSMPSDNILEFGVDDEKKKMGTIPYSKYIRLLPTVDKLNLGDNLESFDYEVAFNGSMNKITFGKKLNYSELIYISENAPIADSVFIKKWKGVYFLSFYLTGYHIYAFPIKEINSESFVLYGVPGEEFDVVVTKL